MIGQEADAADAAQVAMMKILERAGEYDKQRPALPWALGIAAWECRTFLKRQHRHQETAEEPQLSDDGAAVGEAEKRLLVEAAMQAMGTLSVIDQQTLLSTYWETAPDAEGATFRKRRARAIVRLRDAFRRIYGLD